MTTINRSAEYKAGYETGKEHAENAATWIVEPGRYDVEAIRLTLQGLEDGDPMAYDSLPIVDLSGQFADSPTPRSLARDLGYDPDDGDLVDDVADGYETAVAEHLEAACVRELRKYL